MNHVPAFFIWSTILQSISSGQRQDWVLTVPTGLSEEKEYMKSEIKSLPTVALRGMTIMPEMVVHFDISRERSIAAVQEAMVEDQKIFLVLQRDQDAEDPGLEEMYEVGTVASVRQIIKLPKKILRVLVAGETRGILKSIEYKTPYLRTEVEILDESDFQIGRASCRERV